MQSVYGITKISVVKSLKIINKEFIQPSHFMQEKVKAQRCFKVRWSEQDGPTS